MPRLSYPLKTYIKAAEKLAKAKGFSKVEYYSKSGSGWRFEAFIGQEAIPTSFWVVHTEHNKKKEITSMEDYRKAVRVLNATFEEFLEILKKC